MALPIINESFKYVNIKLPSGKSIGVRGWKVKDEKSLLFALESETDIKQNKINHIISFLRNCVDDVSKFDKFSESDIKYACIEIRKLSKGDEISYNYKCSTSGCKFVIEDIVNLSKDKYIKEFDISPVKINPNFILTFKDIEWLKVKELDSRFKDSEAKFTFYYIMNSIDSITYNNETYTEFTENELIEFIDQFDSDDMKKIYEEFYKRDSIVDLKRSVKCLKCGESTEIDFGDLLSFLIL